MTGKGAEVEISEWANVGFPTFLTDKRPSGTKLVNSPQNHTLAKTPFCFTMASASKSSKNTSRAILVIAGILVLSALGYLATKYFTANEVIKENEIKIEELRNEILDLDKKLVEFELTEKDNLETLEEQDQLLSRQSQALDSMQLEIVRYRKENKANLVEIRKLESQLTRLDSILTVQQATIQYYQQKYAEMQAANDSLINNETLLIEQNQNLMDQADRAEQEKREIQQIASVLKASDIRFLNVRKNGKEEEGKEFGRRRMNELKVCFTILENHVAKAGKREIYLVYENPIDATQNLNYADGISGKFVYEGAEKEYSAKTSVNFKNVEQEVCITFKPDSELKDKEQFQKGDQYIALFTDRNMIGSGSFVIK